MREWIGFRERGERGVRKEKRDMRKEMSGRRKEKRGGRGIRMVVESRVAGERR